MELRAVSEALVAYYAEKGYLARALLPLQDVEGGVILIQIVEGERGSLQINNNGKRARSRYFPRKFSGSISACFRMARSVPSGMSPGWLGMVV